MEGKLKCYKKSVKILLSISSRKEKLAVRPPELITNALHMRYKARLGARGWRFAAKNSKKFCPKKGGHGIFLALVK